MDRKNDELGNSHQGKKKSTVSRDKNIREISNKSDSNPRRDDIRGTSSFMPTSCQPSALPHCHTNVFIPTSHYRHRLDPNYFRREPLSLLKRRIMEAKLALPSLGHGSTCNSYASYTARRPLYQIPTGSAASRCNYLEKHSFRGRSYIAPVPARLNSSGTRRPSTALGRSRPLPIYDRMQCRNSSYYQSYLRARLKDVQACYRPFRPNVTRDVVRQRLSVGQQTFQPSENDVVNVEDIESVEESLDVEETSTQSESEKMATANSNKIESSRGQVSELRDNTLSGFDGRMYDPCANLPRSWRGSRMHKSPKMRDLCRKYDDVNDGLNENVEPMEENVETMGEDVEQTDSNWEDISEDDESYRTTENHGGFSREDYASMIALGRSDAIENKHNEDNLNGLLEGEKTSKNLVKSGSKKTSNMQEKSGSKIFTQSALYDELNKVIKSDTSTKASGTKKNNTNSKVKKIDKVTPNETKELLKSSLDGAVRSDQHQDDKDNNEIQQENDNKDGETDEQKIIKDLTTDIETRLDTILEDLEDGTTRVLSKYMQKTASGNLVYHMSSPSVEERDVIRLIEEIQSDEWPNKGLRNIRTTLAFPTTSKHNYKPPKQTCSFSSDEMSIYLQNLEADGSINSSFSEPKMPTWGREEPHLPRNVESDEIIGPQASHEMFCEDL